MTVIRIRREEMAQRVRAARMAARDGSHEDLCRDLMELETMVCRDGRKHGYEITAAEGELKPLLAPYVRMLTREQHMLCLMTVGRYVSVETFSDLAFVERNVVCNVTVPVSLPRATITLSLLPLSRRAGRILDLDCMLESVFPPKP